MILRSPLELTGASRTCTIAWRIRGPDRVEGVVRRDGTDLLHLDMRRLSAPLELGFRDPVDGALRGRSRWDQRHGGWGRATVTDAGGAPVVHAVKAVPGWRREPWYLEGPDRARLADLVESAPRSMLRRYLRLPSRWDVVVDEGIVATLVDAPRPTRFAATLTFDGSDLSAESAERIVLGSVVRHARHLH